MFDFVKNTHWKISILPPAKGVLKSIELIDMETGYFERIDITDEATDIRHALDMTAAKIARKKADDYSRKYNAQKRREMDDFWRNK